MVTGTARLVQDAKDAAYAQQRQQEIERLRSELQNRRALLQANVAVLEAEFRLKEAEMQPVLTAEEQAAAILAKDRYDRAILRQADATSNVAISGRIGEQQ